MMRSSSGIVCAVAGALLFAVACSWGGASDPNKTHPDAGGTAGAVCGDGTCSATEINNCPQDCGSGGHGSNTGSNGSGSGSNVQAVCGNNVCDPGEDATSCPADCTGGGGSGALDCTDQTVVFACLACAIDMTQCTGDINAANCAPCFM